MTVTLTKVIVAQAIKITGLEEEVAELNHDAVNLKASVDFLSNQIKKRDGIIKDLEKENNQ